MVVTAIGLASVQPWLVLATRDPWPIRALGRWSPSSNRAGPRGAGAQVDPRGSKPVVRGATGDAEKVRDVRDSAPLVDVEALKPVSIGSLVAHKCRSSLGVAAPITRQHTATGRSAQRGDEGVGHSGRTFSWAKYAAARLRISISATRSLRAQVHDLGPLRGRGPVVAALVHVGLGHPVPKTRLGDPEILRYHGDRLLPQPSQLDSSSTELRGTRSRHWGLLPEMVLPPSAQVSAPAGDAQRALRARFPIGPLGLRADR